MKRFALAGAAVLILLLAIVMIAFGTGSGGDGAKRDHPRPDPVDAERASRLPNVIFVYTDDQNAAEFKRRYMPRTFELIADRGVVFDDLVVATPLCCPSRATYLTGAYPHNDGVFANRNGYSNLDGKRNTLGLWMRNAGYRTAWVGKYLQGYEQGVEDPLRPPPGIDEWYATFEPRYYGVEMAINGEQVNYGDRSRDYYTNLLTKHAVGLIERQAQRKRPLYMTLNHLAPHHGDGANSGPCSDLVVPAPRDEDAYRGKRLPRGPAFDEADVSDKPSSVRLPRLSEKKIERLELTHRCRLASLRGVDRSNATIIEALKRTGELRRSVIIFTSDNGFLEGQHRRSGKNSPYEEGIRMPLAIYVGADAMPGSPARGARVSELVSNIDFAPTILELAKGEPCARPGNCRALDGLSLVPLLRGARSPRIEGRKAILIEGGKGRQPCNYAGLRSSGLVYLEHLVEVDEGDCEVVGVELYDLSGELTGEPDPRQLDNVASPRSRFADEPRVKAALARLPARLDRLQACSGRSCH